MPDFHNSSSYLTSARKPISDKKKTCTYINAVNINKYYIKLSIKPCLEKQPFTLPKL